MSCRQISRMRRRKPASSWHFIRSLRRNWTFATGSRGTSLWQSAEGVIYTAPEVARKTFKPRLDLTPAVQASPGAGNTLDIVVFDVSVSPQQAPRPDNEGPEHPPWPSLGGGEGFAHNGHRCSWEPILQV